MADWHEWRDAPSGDYAVLGDPVSHSLSPRMHQANFDALGLKSTYLAVRVPELEFPQALARLSKLGYLGVNATVPLKEAAYRWARDGDSRIGALNTLRLALREGIGTDGPGFLETLGELGVDVCRTLILGAGGTAKTLAVALNDAGFEVAIHSRTHRRAHAIVEESGCPIQVLERPDASGCGLIVNATSAGLSGESPALDWDTIPSQSLVYDVFYTDGRTPFLRLAESRGNLRTIDGRRLLVAQGALAFEWWTGLRASRKAMMQAVL